MGNMKGQWQGDQFVVADEELSAALDRLPPSGTSVPGTVIVRRFAFAYNTAGILTGHTVWTPAVGDILLDAWIEVDTAWDGTTPMGDLGNFSAGNLQGFFVFDGQGAIDMTVVDNERLGPGMLGSPSNSDLVRSTLTNTGAQPQKRELPSKFTTTDPIKVVVSQDGTIGGASPASTQGAGAVFLVTSTPA